MSSPSQWAVDLSLHMGGIRTPMPPGVVLLGAYVPGIQSLVTVSRSILGGSFLRGSVRSDLEAHAREAEQELLGLVQELLPGDIVVPVVTQADISLGRLLLNGLLASLPLVLIGLAGISEGMPPGIAFGAAAAGGLGWSVFRACEWRRSIDRSLREVRYWFHHFSSSSSGPRSLDAQFIVPPDAPAMLVRVLPLELRGGRVGPT